MAASATLHDDIELVGKFFLDLEGLIAEHVAELAVLGAPQSASLEQASR